MTANLKFLGILWLVCIYPAMLVLQFLDRDSFVHRETYGYELIIITTLLTVIIIAWGRKG